MNIFDGYVLTKDKKCIEQFKDHSKLKTYDEVKTADEFAGVLAENTVLIDVDDSEQSEILMNIVEEMQLDCRVVKTTRGKHFFFKNNGNFDKCHTGTKLACGLTADIKVGLKNSYAICKFDGKERFVEWDGEVGEVPAWLQPVVTNTDFANMKEGDGRDTALFSYILNLQSAGIGKDDAITAIKLINQYLLKDKMSDADIERITRDDAFSTPVFFEKKQFLFDKFAKYLITEHHIKRINGQLHIYKDGVYIHGLSLIENAMITHIPNLTRARRKEVLDYIEIYVTDDTPTTEAKYIAFKNGLLNLETDDFAPFTPDVILTNIIPHDYDPYAYDELADNTLNKLSCNNGAIRSLLEEMAGYCLYRRNELGKAFILTGSGANGKSTYLTMIRHMLGKQNTSVLDMSKLADRFSTVMIYNKLANIGDDISDGYIDDSAVFKKIVTGEAIDAEQKGQPKFNFEPYVKLIFSANNIPRIGKGRDSKAIMRRLVIIPFRAHFSSADPDYVPFISDKLKTESAVQYLINLGIRALKRVLADNEFTVCKAVDNELREFEETNNPIVGFLRENDVNDFLGKSTLEGYINYTEYCTSAGCNALSRNEFTKQVKAFYNINVSQVRIGARRDRIFTNDR